MRVVVTGASGNIGTAFLRAAAHRPEWDIVGLARRVPARRPPYDVAEWVECDLDSDEAPDVLPKVFTGADAVVHLAWAIHPGTDEPPRNRTNIEGSQEVLAAVADAGVPHLVCASSVAAYTPGPRWTRVDEDWPRAGVPGSAYSRDKARLERLVELFARQHPDIGVAVFRPCAVAQHESGSQLARWTLSPLLPTGILGNRWLPVPLWDGLRGQVVHSGDVADAICRMLDRRAEGAFNLAAEPVLGVHDLTELLGGFRVPVPRRLITGLALPTWRLGLQPMHPGWLTLADQVPLMDTTRARAHLGWEPRHDAKETLAEVIAGMRDGSGAASGPLAPRDVGRWSDRLAGIKLGRPIRQTQA
ncbi:NAD-dependent epimerase/dehydratase family protein [Amycolatopsis thermophila]|uniref:Nucleoside-diphosphate-sugar epimerase n=1 Tax=Amycolatopsis thermophila TaxID=206084 RepID=A0ABU0EVV3_9PSEU|nr:NAD-dependent epimerase/dehydratase family protein [Amycolatopsis thermophila]MDQ0379454.1 nucleoside-diphosphate-sugar epimerase [Amycolatopsis thermophila]